MRQSLNEQNQGNSLFCSDVKKTGFELKYITKITSIIVSDEILNRPMYVGLVNRHAHPICLLSIWAKRKCTFLLNFVLSKMYNYLFNFRPVLLGAPLQLGALSARLVRLWVNPALRHSQTDRRTDRQTDDLPWQYRAVRTSHGKNICSSICSW